MKVEIIFKDDKKEKPSSCGLTITIEDSIDSTGKNSHLMLYGSTELNVTLYESTYSELLMALTSVLVDDAISERHHIAINEYIFNDTTLEKLCIANVEKRNAVADNYYEFTKIKNTQAADWNMYLASVLENNNEKL